MTALLLRVRSEVRGRLGSWVAVALLVGVVGGAVVAVAAGARRTSSAYPRLVAKQKPLEGDNDWRKAFELD